MLVKHTTFVSEVLSAPSSRLFNDAVLSCVDHVTFDVVGIMNDEYVRVWEMADVSFLGLAQHFLDRHENQDYLKIVTLRGNVG
jgi:hypothetical protein